MPDPQSDVVLRRRIAAAERDLDAQVYALYNPTAIVLTARNNYWGDPSGPSHMTNSVATAAIASSSSRRSRLEKPELVRRVTFR